MHLRNFAAAGLLVWSLGAVAQQIITIPKGYVTDLTSIPQFFLVGALTLSKTGPYQSIEEQKISSQTPSLPLFQSGKQDTRRLFYLLLRASGLSEIA
jgi:hypothetical protein